MTPQAGQTRYRACCPQSAGGVPPPLSASLRSWPDSHPPGKPAVSPALRLPLPLRLRRGLQEEGYRRNGTVNRRSDGQPYAHSCNSRHVDATARIPAEMRNSDKPEPSEFMGENTNRLGQKTLRQRPESLIQQGFPVKCRQIVASLPLAAYAGSSCFHP